MVSSKTNLLAFNFFAHPVEFNFDGLNKQGHWTGILGSYIFLILLCIVTSLFGMDFYTRANPSINQIQTSLTDYKETVNKVKDFPVLVYGLVDVYHHRVAPYFYENGAYQKVGRQCTEKELASFYFDKNERFRYYCIDIAKIEMDEKQLSSFYFLDCASLNLAGLKKEEWGFNNCPPLTEKQREDYSTYYVYFYSPKVKLEMNNYDSPISTYYEPIVTSFKVRELRAMKIKQTFVQVKDDKGWIFKNETSTYGVRFDINLETILDFDYDSFYMRNQIDVSKVVETNIRNYTKLQNLAAEVGGFLKVCMFIFRLPLVFISQKNLKAKCIHKFLLGQKASLTKRKVPINALTELSKDGNKSGNHLMKNTLVKPSTKPKTNPNILSKLIWKRSCSKKREDLDRLLRAEEVINEILSVESIFKNKQEMDVLKRFILSEEQQVLLQTIREPNVLDSQDEVASKLLEDKKQQMSTCPAREALKKKIERKETLTGFEKAIKDYL